MLAYVVLHIAIDAAKNWLVNRRTGRDSIVLFLIDQALHVAAVMALAWVFTRYRWRTSRLAWIGRTGGSFRCRPFVSCMWRLFLAAGICSDLTRSLTVPLRE